MRFPFSLTRSMAAYLLRKNLAGEKRFPLVLMLEPLHACNLSCAGCGRIREYADTMHCRLTLERCLAAAAECGAPIVSICGGEPLLYPDIENLVDRLISNRKHVYLCTNGVLLEKKLRGFRPSSYLSLNVHIDGMEASHDRMVQHAGDVCGGRPRHPRRESGRFPRVHQHDHLSGNRHARDCGAVSVPGRDGRRRLHDFAGLRLRGRARRRSARRAGAFHDAAGGA